MLGICSAQGRILPYYSSLLGLSCGVRYNHKFDVAKRFFSMNSYVILGPFSSGNFRLQKIRIIIIYLRNIVAFSSCQDE